MNVNNIYLAVNENGLLFFIIIQYGSQWGPSAVGSHIIQNTVSSFVFSRRKKLIQVWNNLRVS